MFLLATSHLIGFLQTFFHEFSHLIAILATKKTPAKVSIYLNNYVTFLSGIYGGSFIYEDSIGLEPKKSNNISAIYLKNKIQTKNIIINSAGPLGGTLIGYFLFKFFKSKNQEIFKNKLFNNICLIGIFGQLINFFPFEGSDGKNIIESVKNKSILNKKIKELKKNLNL